MAQPTDYKYINSKDEKNPEWGYEVSYMLKGAPQTCRIICKPLKNNRMGIYETRTNCERAIYSFYNAKNEHEAGSAMQRILDEALTEIRRI